MVCCASVARLAWFSPMPPVRSGIAAYSADLVEQLQRDHTIDLFVDDPVVHLAAGLRSAHDFIWRHQQHPYDLTVFQMGNSSHHDYIWPYLFRYPGLIVLHDVHLHHARAAALLRARRADDYRAEFCASDPGADPDLAELAVAGFDTHLYYRWPMTRLAARAARLVAVHSDALAERLSQDAPGADVIVVRLGHGVALSDDREHASRARGRGRYGIAPDAPVFGCFGGLTPDKRLPQILDAFAATLPYAPSARLLLAGATAEHYDVGADVARRGLAAHTILTGYLDSDESLTDCIAASDVSLNLRWPTARELSGPWLRSLALGRATVILDLAHLATVPSLDPRTWRARLDGSGPLSPVCVAVDVLDEDHSLKLALRRLAVDTALRDRLGRSARDYWQRFHAVSGMVDDYGRAIARAIAAPTPDAPLPAHLIDDGGHRLRAVMSQFGLDSPLR
jgi:glycosyltransferase involved in cell wall biosynthesis